METIINKKQASEYLNIPEDKIFNFYRFENEDWEYEDLIGYYHLYRKIDGYYIELTDEIEAEFVFSYENGDWGYEDIDGYEHLFRKIDNRYIELTKNIDTIYVLSFNNGYWLYEDGNGLYHLYNEYNEFVGKYNDVDDIKINLNK